MIESGISSPGVSSAEERGVNWLPSLTRAVSDLSIDHVFILIFLHNWPFVVLVYLWFDFCPNKVCPFILLKTNSAIIDPLNLLFDRIVFPGRNSPYCRLTLRFMKSHG